MPLNGRIKFAADLLLVGLLVGLLYAQTLVSFEIDHTLLLRLNQLKGYVTLFEVHPWLYYQDPTMAVKDYLITSVSNPTSWYNIDKKTFYEQVFVGTCAQLEDLYRYNKDYFDSLPTVDADRNKNLLCRVSSIIRDCKLYKTEAFVNGLMNAMAKTIAELMLNISASSSSKLGPSYEPSGFSSASPRDASSSPPRKQHAGPSWEARQGKKQQEQQQEVASVSYQFNPMLDLGLLTRVKNIKGYRILFEAHPWLFSPLPPVEAIKEYLIKKIKNPAAWVQVELKNFHDKFFVRACNQLIQVHQPNKMYFDNLPTIHADPDTNLLCRVSSIVRDCILYQSSRFGQDLSVSLLSTVVELISEGTFDSNPSASPAH